MELISIPIPYCIFQSYLQVLNKLAILPILFLEQNNINIGIPYANDLSSAILDANFDMYADDATLSCFGDTMDGMKPSKSLMFV